MAPSPVDSLDPRAWAAWEQARAAVYGATEEQVLAAVHAAGREPLSLGHVAALLSPRADCHLERLARGATAVTRQRFGRTVVLYVPLYLSNSCTNLCTYCGFRTQKATKRRTLTLPELDEELRALKDRGFDHLLLLTGEDRRAAPPGYLCEAVARAHRLFASVSVEVYPMDRSEYGDLVSAGCDGLTLYQETYHQDTYARVHAAGPKADFARRFRAPELGAQAGLRSVSLGVLLGLADCRVDGLLLAAHGALLKRRFWRIRLGFGFPRLRGNVAAESPVNRKQLAHLIFALRLAFPDADLVLSTREDESFRDGMAGLGITRMSAGSRTSPGAYSLNTPAHEQFSVADRRSPEQVVSMLGAKGLDPVWKDWDRGFIP